MDHEEDAVGNPNMLSDMAEGMLISPPRDNNISPGYGGDNSGGTWVTWSLRGLSPSDIFDWLVQLLNCHHYLLLIILVVDSKVIAMWKHLRGTSIYYTKEMDLFSFIRTADPTKVRVGERQRAEGEPKLLDTTVGRVVPILPVSPARTSSELEARISRNYTLDEDTYPQFLRDNDEEMDLLSFIRTADPTKVRVGERQRAEGEPKLLDTTVGRVVPILPVSPARTSSELEASIEKIFDKGVSATADIVVEDVAPVQPKRQRKRKTTVSDAGEPSHPPKKLREDHGTSTGPSVAGRTITAPLRFVISSDSSYHSDANITEAEVDSFARPSFPLMTMAITVTSTADPTTTAKERFVEPSIFGGGSSSGAEHNVGGFSGLTSSDFIVGGIRIVVSPDTDLQKVYVPQWIVTNGSRLDDGRTCREMVYEFAPLKFFALIRGMEHDQLFTEFNIGVARQMSLSAEVRMRVEFNIREKRRLCSIMEDKDSLLKARDEEIRSLKVQLLMKEMEVAEAIHLRVEASKFEVVEKYLQDEIKSLKERTTALEKEKGVLDVKVADLVATVKVREQEAADSDVMVTTIKLQNDRLADLVRELETSYAGLQEKVAMYENCMSPLEKLQDEQMAVVHEKFNKLDSDFIETCLHLEERLYPHMLTTIAGRRWLLTYGMKLAVFKCLNSLEYLSALGAAISKAIEKGMQDGLAAVITHGQEGRVLTDVVAFNPSAEDDFTSALQEVQNVNFSLLAKLQSNKDASVETVMDLLRLDEALRKDVYHGRVQRIRENIANNISALRDVFVSFSKPLSIVALEGMAGTSSVAPDTTIALSVTFASASTILPIFMDDYEIAHAEDQGNAGADVDSFPNVDDVELIIS
ncbi:hypothetical protein Tco_0622035 [Tanacetum coccineum]